MNRRFCPQLVITIVSLLAQAAVGQTLYWSQNSIWKSDLDGGHVSVFEPALCARSLTLDRSRAELLYADVCLGGIFSVDLRTRATVRLVPTEPGTTVALAVDNVTESIYWIDSLFSTIYRADRRDLRPEALWVLRPGGTEGAEQFSDIAVAEDEASVYVLENDISFSSRGYSYLLRGDLQLGTVEELARNTWPGTIGQARALMDLARDRFTRTVYVRVFEYNLHPYIGGIHHIVERYDPDDWSSATIYQTSLLDVGLQDIAIDERGAMLYLLHGDATGASGAIERVPLDQCQTPRNCTPEVVVPATIVQDGNSIVVDPCGLDEFPRRDDLADLTSCLGNAKTQATRSCACYDFDEDLDVDLRDVARLQQLYNAP